jgi:glycosyltransferase involved in cell wall biosynthesis
VATPHVSVVLAARDAERTIAGAVASVLDQTFRDLELVVVDDGSVDGTAAALGAVEDDRLRLVRNDAPLGLAGALNVGFDAARGSLLARMDADDLALPRWLDRVVGRIRSAPAAAVVGAAMIDLHDDGGLGTVHLMPRGARSVRWAALFSSPFFHSTLVIDRAVLDEHGLRYDTAFGESEDYDLWARLLSVADGDNVGEPLVLYRKHSEQASARRALLQRECQREVALRQIAALVPALDPRAAELAWLVGAGRPLPEGTLIEAADALEQLVIAFEGRYGGREARHAAARALARAPTTGHGAQAEGGRQERNRLVRARTALRLDPLLPLHAAGRVRRRHAAEGERKVAQRWLDAGREGPLRLTMVIPEPTPFRTVMFDRIAERPELDLTAIYAGGSVQRRTWTIEPRHRAVFLEGLRIPGAYRVLRHEYPVSLDVFEQLRRARPDVVVVSGWSTFASQAAAEWCRRQGIPYVLLVESNERDARPGWRRAVKGAVVPRIVGGAAEVLVVGRLAREAMLARGVPPERISLFADTIDVEHFGREADRLASRRGELRAEAGLGPSDVAVLCVARLAPEKGQDTLVRAVAAAGDPRLVLLLAGSGAERDRLVALAEELGVRLVLLPDVPWRRIVERFVLADVFALLSRHEPWGVVVNEAAACGLPLVLSDRVGAAFDLLEHGRNGALVPADDHVAAGTAIRDLAADPERRRAAGEASREIMRDWGYEPSVENLLRVARRVAGRHASESASA